MLIIYTTPTCNKCQLLKKIMNEKNIPYEECDDIEVMKAKGLRMVPCLEVDGTLLGFTGAFDWLRNQEGK